jgi:hypothetical protein
MGTVDGYHLYVSLDRMIAGLKPAYVRSNTCLSGVHSLTMDSATNPELYHNTDPTHASRVSLLTEAAVNSVTTLKTRLLH